MAQCAAPFFSPLSAAADPFEQFSRRIYKYNVFWI